MSEGDRGVTHVMFPSSLPHTESVTFEIEGNENKVTKSIDFIIQSCSNFQGICTICHIMKCFLVEQNRFSHLKVTVKYSSVAFLLPLSELPNPWNTLYTEHPLSECQNIHCHEFKTN